MSVQDKLNSYLESMNINPINLEENPINLEADTINLEADTINLEAVTINLEADTKDYVVKNSKEYLVEDDFELDYKVNLDKNNILKMQFEEMINEIKNPKILKNKSISNKNLQSVNNNFNLENKLFDQNLSFSQKIRLDEMINFEVKKRLDLQLEMAEDIIKKKFIDKENELKKKEKNIKETKKRLNEKIKLNQSIKIKFQLKEQEIVNKSAKIQEDLQKLEKDQKDIELSIINERNNLTQEYDKLVKLKDLFDSGTENKYIKINVSGTIFETTERILKTYSQYFYGLLSDNFKVLKDDNDIIFIDRCPDLFKEIMKIMRDLDRYDEIEMNINDKLKKELDYYLISS